MLDGNAQMVEGHQGAVAGIETAISGVAAAIPYAICPYCHAAEPMQAGCKACGAHGYIGRHRWDTAISGAAKDAGSPRQEEGK